MVYIGDYGFALTITVTTDSTTNIVGSVIKIKKPSGAEEEWSSDFNVIDANTVEVKHVVQQGEIDEAGLWKAQAVITYSDGTQHAETVEFVVKNEFE